MHCMLQVTEAAAALRDQTGDGGAWRRAGSGSRRTTVRAGGTGGTSCSWRRATWHGCRSGGHMEAQISSLHAKPLDCSGRATSLGKRTKPTPVMVAAYTYSRTSSLARPADKPLAYTAAAEMTRTLATLSGWVSAPREPRTERRTLQRTHVENVYRISVAKKVRY